MPRGDITEREGKVSSRGSRKSVNSPRELDTNLYVVEVFQMKRIVLERTLSLHNRGLVLWLAPLRKGARPQSKHGVKNFHLCLCLTTIPAAHVVLSFMFL